VAGVAGGCQWRRDERRRPPGAGHDGVRPGAAAALPRGGLAAGSGRRAAAARQGAGRAAGGRSRRHAGQAHRQAGGITPLPVQPAAALPRPRNGGSLPLSPPPPPPRPMHAPQVSSLCFSLSLLRQAQQFEDAAGLEAALLSRARALLGSFDAQQLATVIIACPHLLPRPSQPWLKQAARQMLELLPGLGPDYSAAVLLALGEMQVDLGKAWLTAFMQHSSVGRARGRPPAWSRLTPGCGSDPLRPGRHLLAPSCPQALLPQSSAEALSTLTLALGTFGQKPDAAWVERFQAASQHKLAGCRWARHRRCAGAVTWAWGWSWGCCLWLWPSTWLGLQKSPLSGCLSLGCMPVGALQQVAPPPLPPRPPQRAAAGQHDLRAGAPQGHPQQVLDGGADGGLGAAHGRVRRSAAIAPHLWHCSGWCGGRRPRRPTPACARQARPGPPLRVAALAASAQQLARDTGGPVSPPSPCTTRPMPRWAPSRPPPGVRPTAPPRWPRPRRTAARMWRLPGPPRRAWGRSSWTRSGRRR
jgi:hypothetical protein